MINFINLLFSPYKSEFKTIKNMFAKKEYLLLSILLLFFVFSFVLYCIPRQPIFIVCNVALVLMCFLIFIYLFKYRVFKINAGVIGLVVYLFLIFAINVTKGIYALSPYVPPIIMIFVYELVTSLDINRKKIVLRLIHISLLVLLIWSYIRYFPGWLDVKNISIFDSYFGNLDGYSNKILLLLALSIFYLRRKYYLSSFTIVASLGFILMTERRVAFLFSIICLVGLLYSLLHKKHLLLFYLLTIMSFLIITIGLFIIPSLSSLRDRLINDVLNTIFTYPGNYAGDSRYFITIRGFYYTFTNMFGAMGYDYVTNVYGYYPPHDLVGDLSFNYGGLFSVIFTLFFITAAINMIRKKGYYRLLSATTGIMLLCYILFGTFIYSRELCLFGSIAMGLIGNSEEQINCCLVKKNIGIYSINI